MKIRFASYHLRNYYDSHKYLYLVYKWMRQTGGHNATQALKFARAWVEAVK